MLNFILSRARELSTLAGFSTLLALFGIPADAAPLVHDVVNGVIAAIGLAAIVMPEKKRSPDA